MAENYTVNYQINVNSDPALESIRKFQEATAEMETLVRRFDAIAKGIGRVNSALASLNKGKVEIRLETSKAEEGLGRVLSLLTQIKSTAKATLSNGKIQIGRNTTTVGGASSLKTSGATTDLTNLVKQIKSTHTSIDNINKRYIHPKANTNTAIKSLDALIRKIKEVKSQSNITITTSASGGSKTINTSRPQRRLVRSVNNKAGLYPSTRQVLGPTYANSGINVVGEMVKGIGVSYGLSTLFSGITNVFKDASDYNNIVQTTRNILSTHDHGVGFDARFNEMNTLMRQVGVETKYTAPQVAEAGKFLAMAGMNVDQIKQAIRPITDIALIGDTSLGETADLITNIMTAYEIPANRMNNAADVLTMTFTKANTTLIELAESFKYAGALAHQAGLSFETSSALFGVLGDAGIKGSHAGTVLRMMINNISNPTKKQAAAWEAVGINPKDKSGNIRNFVDILSELHEASKKMSNGDFTTLVGQMFRITAAPGALALISHSDKLKEVVDKNYSSMGISSILANEKKNTIQGLWYQISSAFTETGMQGFEQMQGVIKDFLQRMTQLMKSPDFAVALKDMLDIFVNISQTIVDNFTIAIKIWNFLPKWAKDGLVGFIKLQMYAGILASTVKSIKSTFIVIKGFLWGRWFTELNSGASVLGRTVQYIKQLYAFSRFAGLNRAASVGQAIGRGIFGSTGLLRGGAGVANAASVAATGSAVGGTTLVGLISSLGSFLFTNPIGWGLMAIGAITGISYEIHKTYEATNAARLANEAWSKSYRQLGLDKLKLSDPDALMIGNMRAFNNELLTHNERIQQSAELWHRYWVEKNAPQSHPDNKTKYIDTAEGAIWQDNLKYADAWFNVHDTFMPIVKDLGGKFSTQRIVFADGTSHLSHYLMLNGRSIPIASNGKLNENAAVQLSLAKLGADQNNSQRMSLEKYLIGAFTSAHSYQDYANLLASARKNYLPTTFNPKWNNISSETAEYMTWADIQSSQAYVLALRQNMEQVFKSWSHFAQILSDADKGKDITPMRIQEALQDRFGILFDTEKGLFGTNSWLAHVQDIVNHPTKYKFDSVKEATGYITDTFEKLISWYNLLDAKYKPLFAAFLNRSSYSSSLPEGYSLPEGGIDGGKKLGDKMTIDGTSYTWSQLGPELIPSWRDKDGRIYTPKDGKNTFKWTPNDNNNLPAALHNGTDQSQYQSHYDKTSAVPKQVIVRIENLMRVDNQTIDMTDDKQVAAIQSIKQELATALLDVVQDFNANMI